MIDEAGYAQYEANKKRVLAELKKDDELPSEESELGYCPNCKNTDLDIDSSFSMGLSTLDCFDCGFHFEGKCDEETLIKRFKKKFKIK